jgi:hypothetical protein
MSKNKLAQRTITTSGYDVSVSLIGDECGMISITDRNLYPDSDSRAVRRDLGYETMMIPLMSREDLKDLRIAIDEVLKNSK